jgi:hypothetical protein
MTTPTQELLIKVESVKNMLVSRATTTAPSDPDYAALRIALVRNPLIKDKLPRFVHTCRSLDDFWGFIKPKFAHYHERQSFIADAFDPVMSFLEQSAAFPADASNEGVLSQVDSPHIAEAWRKALDRRADDAEGAITAARSLLETTCKHILDEASVKYDEAADLPKLYKLAAETLNLAPSQHTEAIFKHILGGCWSVVEGLGALRNRLSDAHGKGKAAIKPAPRHAGLAVNLAGAMASFLIETWEHGKPKSPGVV